MADKPEKTDRQTGMLHGMLSAIMDANPNPVFWKDAEGVYIGANLSFVEYVGKSSKDEVIGRTDADLFDKETSEMFVSCDRNVMETKKPYEGFESTIDKNGKRSYMKVTKLPLFDGDVSTGVVGLSTNLTDMRRMSAKLNTIGKVTEIIMNSTDFAKAANSVMNITREYYDAARAYMFEINAADNTASNTFEVCAAGVKSEMDVLQNIPFSPQFDYWTEQFKKNGYLSISAVKEMSVKEREIERRMLEMQDIGSLICAPFYENGALSGFIGVDDPKNAADDKDFLITICSYISGEMKKRRSSERYRKLAEENSAMLRSSPGGIGVFSAKAGVFSLEYVTDSFYESQGMSREYWQQFMGAKIMDVLLPEDRPALMEEIQRLLDDRHHYLFDDTFRVFKEDGGVHWMNLKARFAYENTDGTQFYYASYTNLDKEKEAEQQASAANQKFESIMDKMPGLAISIVEIRNNRSVNRKVSAELCRMLGCTPEEVDGVFPIDNRMVHPDDLKRITYDVIGKVEPGKTAHAAYRIMMRNGTYKWFESAFSFVKIDGRQYIYTSYTDIDEFKKKEAEAEKRYQDELNYREALGHGFLCSLRVNLTRNVIEEASGLKVNGKTISQRAELIKNNYDRMCSGLLDAMSAEDGRGSNEAFLKDLSRSSLLEKFEAGTSVFTAEHMIKRSGGTNLWCEWTVRMVRRPGERDVVAFIYARDVRRQKILDSIISTFVKNQYDYIKVIDGRENSYEIVSTREDITNVLPPVSIDYEGTMREDVRAHFIAEDADALIKFMSLDNLHRELDEKDIAEHYATTYSAEEGLRYKKIWVTYLNRADDMLALVRSDCTEVQKEQRLEKERLKKALDAAKKANAAKSEFLSHMSHDIRTPMNAIMGMTDLALDEAQNAGTAEYLRKIKQSSQYLLGLINDVLDMSRIENDKVALTSEDINIHDFIQGLNSMVKPQMDAKHIKFTTEIGPGVEENIYTDRLRINEIFVNLLSNAAKYTPDGGEVTMSVKFLSRSGDTVFHRTSVRDTGCGMSPEFTRHCFDAFSQENTFGETQGTGLGLAIVKNLVGILGGKITVESERGKGTVFVVDLPSVVSAETERENNSRPNHIEISKSAVGKKILLAEDNEINREIATLLLKKKGYTVASAVNGREAVDMFGKSEEGWYSAVLMDIRMPEMNGLEAARAIRALKRGDAERIPIIAMTANAFDEDVRASRKAGMNAHLSKPIDPPLLYRTIAELTEEAGAPK